YGLLPLGACTMRDRLPYRLPLMGRWPISGVHLLHYLRLLDNEGFERGVHHWCRALLCQPLTTHFCSSDSGFCLFVGVVSGSTCDLSAPRQQFSLGESVFAHLRSDYSVPGSRLSFRCYRRRRTRVATIWRR